MKPAWDKLMTEYKGNKDVLIGDCDCTADGKSLCEEVGVQGYPTIKYGDPSALEDYQGGRDFDSLKKHAETKLKPSCSPTNLHLCDDAKKAEVCAPLCVRVRPCARARAVEASLSKSWLTRACM